MRERFSFDWKPTAFSLMDEGDSINFGYLKVAPPPFGNNKKEFFFNLLELQGGLQLLKCTPGVLLPGEHLARPAKSLRYGRMLWTFFFF